MAISLASAAVGLALTLLIALYGRPVRDTTLVGPWLWGIVSGLLLTLAALSAMAPQMQGDGWGALLRYAAEISTLCPVVALLGARRPQHAAWQFVVATLFVILLLPAVQGSRSGGGVSIEAPWTWFLLALWGVGFFNLLPTLHWPCAISFALGQSILLAPRIVGGPAAASNPASPWLLIAIALMLLGVVLLRRRAVAVRGTTAWLARDPLDRLWLDFRDSYGLLWAIRVQQRVNAAADQFDWPVALAWDGFYDRASGEPVKAVPPASRPAIEHALRMLLWRFMSLPWMDGYLSSK